MRRLTLLLALLCAVTLATDSAAQEEGRKAGSWGFEGGIGATPSLLRFRSPVSAWVFGLNAQYNRIETKTPGLAPGGGTNANTLDNSFIELRVGLRGYGPLANRVQRYWTVSGIAGYESSSTFGDGPRLGGAGELGAAYFFTPHVSLGGSGELNALYTATDEGDIASRNSWLIRFAGFRLVGAIYF